MSWLDADKNPTIEIGHAHVGSEKHAPKPMAHPAGRWYEGSDPEQAAKLVALFGDVGALAAALGLRWCAECHDFHEVAGGPSAGVRAQLADSSAVASGGSAPTM